MSARRRVLGGAIAALLLAPALALAAPTAAHAAPPDEWISDEVAGNTIAARAATQALQTPWRDEAVVRGGVLHTFVFASPAYGSGSVIDGAIGMAGGITVSVTRTQYTLDTDPQFIEVSTSPGIATCTGSGNQLQDASPRPTSLTGGAGCTSPALGGFGYSESGGSDRTRDAVEFSFDSPVLGFGAWFGDLETRTDGNGVPALLRLYAEDGTLLSETEIVPTGSQAACGSGVVGCGNQTTRWIGFHADPSEPIARMVVLVGNLAPFGGLSREGLGFIGATLDTSTAGLALTKTHDPLVDTNGDGMIGAGDTVTHRFGVENTGSRPVTGLAIVDPGATGLACETPLDPLASGGVRACSGEHVLTQAEVDAGGYVNAATASAQVAGGTVGSGQATDTVAIPADGRLSLALAAAPASYSAAGETVVFTHTVRNTGNVTIAAPELTQTTPGAGAFTTDCASPLAASLAPGQELQCTSAYTVMSADVGAGAVTLAAEVSGDAAGAVPQRVSSGVRSAEARFVAASAPGQLPVMGAEPAPPLVVALLLTLLGAAALLAGATGSPVAARTPRRPRRCPR